MAMCAMCFCVFLSIFNLARTNTPCVLRVFVFFPGPRTDNQCVLCVFVFFLTKLSNLDTAKPRRVSCVFVFFPTPTHYSSQWPCVLCVFVSFYHFFDLDSYLTWANAPCVLFVFVYFAQVSGHITNAFVCSNFWLRSTGAEMIPKLKKGKVGPVDCASNILHAEANIFSLTSAFEITIWLVREKRIQ